MNRNEFFEKNLVLATEFSKYILEHPEVAEQIPKDAVIVILPEYDQEMTRENLKIAEARRDKNQPMILVRVKRLAPPRKSRLVRPIVEMVAA